MHAEVHMAIQLYRNDVNYLHRVIELASRHVCAAMNHLLSRLSFILKSCRAYGKTDLCHPWKPKKGGSHGPERYSACPSNRERGHTSRR